MREGVRHVDHFGEDISMEKIKIAITERVASVVALPEVVADNAEYEVDFALDPREGWDMSLPITALFVRRDGSYTPRIMDAGKTSCTMPPQTGTNIVYVGLTQDDMRTTTPATIKVHRSIRTVAHDPLPAPSEDVYAQILAAYAGIKILSGKGAPTSATQGKVNQLYRDEDTQKLYICTATDGGYTWAAVSGGSVDVDATLTKAGYAADAKAAGDALAEKIDAPQVAQVGEALTVEEVDAEGKPKKWKTAPAAAEQVQSDWAQNDETAADYVKNRPGGYMDKTESIIMDGLLDSNKRLDFAVDEGRKYNVKIGDSETIEVIGTKEAVTEGGQTAEIIYIGSATYGEIVTGAVSSYWFIGTVGITGITQSMCKGEYINKHTLITSLADTTVKIPEKYLDLPKNPIGEYFATSDNDDLSNIEIPDHIKLIRVHCVGVNTVNLPFKAQTDYEVINHENNILNVKQGSTVVGLIPPLYTCLLSSGRQKIASKQYDDADYGMHKYMQHGGLAHIGCGVLIDANNEAEPNGSGYIDGVIIDAYDLTPGSSMMLIKRRGYVTAKINTAQGDSYSQAITSSDRYIKIVNAGSDREGIRKYIGSDSEFYRLARVHGVNEADKTAKIELL